MENKGKLNPGKSRVYSMYNLLYVIILYINKYAHIIVFLCG